MYKPKTKRFDTYVYLAFAVFYLWMAAQIPYTHDDWDWGLSIGMQQLITASLNGRYGGNFFVVVMTRSELLKTLIMGSVYFLIPFTVSVIASAERKENREKTRLVSFLLCNVLLLSMDRKIWQQTYGWVAGFANFVISALFMLIIFQRCLSVFHEAEGTPAQKNRNSAILFILGLVSQLFLENLAVFLFIFSILIIFFCYKRHGHVSKEYFFLTAGTAIGLFLIFSSSIFHTLWDDGSAIDGYRQLFINSNTNIGDLIFFCIRQASHLPYRIWENNLIICLCILLLLNVLLLRKQTVPKKWKTNCIVINSIFCVFFAADQIFQIISYVPFSGIFSSLFFLTVAGEILLLFADNRPYMYKLLVVWISALGVIAPLIVTSERGPRLFFTSNVLLILFAALLVGSILEHSPETRSHKAALFAAVLAMALVICHGKIYYEIGACKAQWEAIIAQAVENGDDVITLPAYPHLEYLWKSKPTNELRLEYFKEFYGIGQDTTIIFE